MRQYQLKLRRNEFSFLDQVAESLGLVLEEVSVLKVQRGDEALMVRKGNVREYRWCEGGYCHYTHFFAIIVHDDGFEVVRLQAAGRSETGSGHYDESDADTIGEQLFVMGVKPDFILEAIQNDTDANGNGVCTRIWTIHKMSKFDQLAHHLQRINEAAVTLKSEITAICTA